jgi:UDP:flavonoid glycosyltransferase YjiC (YdhE family)
LSNRETTLEARLNALLVAIGSHGDVHPFVGIALRLRARGHDVTIMANGHFEGLVRRAGLDFAPVGTAEEYQAMALRPELWHPSKGLKLVLEGTVQGIRPVYDNIMGRHVPGETVVVASTLGLGARVAQDKHGIPTATVQLQPSILRSVHHSPRLPGSPIRSWQPAWFQHALWWAADRFFIDPGIAPGVNAFRAEVGLPPVRRIMKDWWNSPDLVLGLFPEWFAPPQPDWPPQTRLTNFPLYDEKGLEPMPAPLVEFLESGDKPIAFTPGSAMWQGHSFFDAAVATCQQLGRRGLLLSRRREHIPPELPPGVMHVEYAPFSELLPRCAALVHHGGIGTSSQAMASGLPQLVTPMAHDQPDNAERLERLGVARWVAVGKFNGGSGARLLGELLTSKQVADACGAVREKLVGSDGIGQTCDLIEQLVPHSVASGV